jgi:hypothetical protein
MCLESRYKLDWEKNEKKKGKQTDPWMENSEHQGGQREKDPQ